jgi:hypothetical protein
MSFGDDKTIMKTIVLRPTDSPYSVAVTDIGGLLPAFNVGVKYPNLGGYNIPFSAFLNTTADLGLIKSLAVAFHRVALALDPERLQPLPHVYDYNYGDDSSWVIRLDRKPCHSLHNTFWGDEPTWKFNHGGMAWELYKVMSELAAEVEAKLMPQELLLPTSA